MDNDFLGCPVWGITERNAYLWGVEMLYLDEDREFSGFFDIGAARVRGVSGFSPGFVDGNVDVFRFVAGGVFGVEVRGCGGRMVAGVGGDAGGILVLRGFRGDVRGGFSGY